MQRSNRSLRFGRLGSSVVAGAALLSLLSFSLIAAAKLSKTGASSTTFKAAGPAGMNIDGSTAEMSVADDGSTVTITVPLGNLTTGIGIRDDPLIGQVADGARDAHMHPSRRAGEEIGVHHVVGAIPHECEGLAGELATLFPNGHEIGEQLAGVEIV